MARKGECVTCENGHYICSAAKDIARCTTVERDQFEHWLSDDLPKQGPEVPNCPVCNAQFIRLVLIGGAALHVSGEWRGFGNYAA